MKPLLSGVSYKKLAIPALFLHHVGLATAIYAAGSQAWPIGLAKIAEDLMAQGLALFNLGKLENAYAQ